MNAFTITAPQGWENGGKMSDNRQLNQARTPLYETLTRYAQEKTAPFFVPGHKMGYGICEEFRSFMENSNLASVDLTLLDTVQEAAEEAQALAAEVFHADHTLFSVHGTSGAIQTMVMGVVNPGEKIIVPRNIHKSVIAGLIMSGADPVYMLPEYDAELGITKNITVNTVNHMLQFHPDAKAVLVTSPSYNGICADVKEIAELVHSRGIPLIVDEAHGSHLQFHSGLPDSAMDCGADISAQSTHKNLSSFTQSSMLHIKDGFVDFEKIKKIMSTFQTTSPSSLLMMSLDWARYQMNKNGFAELDRVLCISKDAIKKINDTGAFFCLDNEMLAGNREFVLDETKITIFNRLGMTGARLEKILVDDYNIQVDCSDFSNVVCFITIGDMEENVQRLISALWDISLKSGMPQKISGKMHMLPKIPVKKLTPREAFFSTVCFSNLKDCVGKICGESVMLYPPGIPMISPGEIITEDIVQYMMELKNQKMNLIGLECLDGECYIKVIRE